LAVPIQINPLAPLLKILKILSDYANPRYAVGFGEARALRRDGE